MKTDSEFAKEAAIKQFLRRSIQAAKQGQVDNRDLLAGEPMFFYCKDCGVGSDILPEDYLFPPHQQCSQCLGLTEVGWMQEAKAEFQRQCKE